MVLSPMNQIYKGRKFENMLLGDMLKSAREDMNQRQQDVAEELDIPQTTLSQYENGERAPNLANLCKLATYYFLDMEAIREMFVDCDGMIEPFRPDEHWDPSVYRNRWK